MTEAAGSSWKDAEVARQYLDERRRAIPLGEEQVAMLLRLARRFVPQAARVADLGCGDGFLARAVLSEFPAAHATLIDHSEPMLRRATRPWPRSRAASRSARATWPHRCRPTSASAPST